MKLAQLERLVINALEDIKARDIEVIDTTRLTALFDRMIIASGDSNRQVRALARNVQEKAHAAGARILSCEGEDAGEWILVDLGDVIVHLMQPAVRSYYDLEELWGGRGPWRAREAATEELVASG
ncbi:ribosome silencing factor [Accumulibacter sp.]|uniref:ribosome silencing factor n=1 Tax=Accumulibacter sp. TaxID=2053492 RepID=UPI0025E27689|nr:ribosome silencing factor [Accumulibacter sp.]MCM8593940.1 ribosome silencing factor [Accumulibacter sp.]MCM8627789.1 ribosome silencing factor [Accumulibacter sp.]MDS4048081.1 ribosome silencing factor [Accumulibacter sp.]